MKIPRPTLLEEQLLWSQGFTHCVGMDEVGRGAFAGPVVTAAVVFSQSFFNKDTPLTRSILASVHDSKLLSPIIREKLDEEIRKSAEAFSIAEISVSTINRYGIGKATCTAFRKTLSDLFRRIPQDKSFVLVDGLPINKLPCVGKKRQKAIIKGDQKCLSIAAASIIAKVYRDRRMKEFHEEYKGYNFAVNKGYGTALHRSYIKQLGLSSLHRTSFNLQVFT